MEISKSNRIHIGLFGRTNVGKSTIFNLIAGQDIAIISDISGTTTDVIEKSLELSTIGPIVIFDTAGIDDNSILGKERKLKTNKVFSRCDVACIIIENNIWTDFEEQLENKFKEEKIPFLIIINDKLLNNDSILIKQLKHPNIIYNINKTRDQFLKEFTEVLHNKLYIELLEKEITIFNNILKGKQVCIFVTPIDSGAPKNRLIMPQVHALRAALDINVISLIVQPSELLETLNLLKKSPDLIVCDSQVVKYVVDNIPNNIRVTTFSMLFSRLKGDIFEELKGANIIEELSKDDKILIAEACSHHSQKDDIGTVKIPNLLRNYLGFTPRIEYINGHEFPEDIDKYKLIIHCGACMLTRTEKLNRINRAKSAGVAISNYGMVISYLNGYLKRVSEVFEQV